MTDTATIQPRSRGLRHIFIGSDGLRAGWSLLLFCLILTVLTIGAVVAGTFINGKLPHAPAGSEQGVIPSIKGEALTFVVLLVTSWLMSLIERRPFATYGLRRARAVPDLIAGMAWGIAMLSLLVGMLTLSGALVFDGFAMSGSTALEYGAAWFFAFCLVGLFEEFLTRGFLQYTLARGVAGIVQAVAPDNKNARTIGFWVAALVFSVGVFAGGHLANKGETAMGLVSVALAGLTFVYVLYRTGSLWWAIGFHATWDWAQSFLYGVRDSGLAMEGHLLASHPAGAALLSGGDTGPEGSILVVPTLLLTVFIIHRTLPRRATAFDA
ncbi:MAG: CPBP family intramembrane glutamic endopeptidase [Pseudomonadota bacterium]